MSSICLYLIELAFEFEYMTCMMPRNIYKNLYTIQYWSSVHIGYIHRDEVFFKIILQN